MKKFCEVFIEELRNTYLYDVRGHTLIPLQKKNDEPTVENFKVIAIYKGEIVVYIAEDFSYWDNDKLNYNFRLGDSYEYLRRERISKDIVELLDATIERLR